MPALRGERLNASLPSSRSCLVVKTVAASRTDTLPGRPCANNPQNIECRYVGEPGHDVFTIRMASHRQSNHCPESAAGLLPVRDGRQLRAGIPDQFPVDSASVCTAASTGCTTRQSGKQHPRTFTMSMDTVAAGRWDRDAPNVFQPCQGSFCRPVQLSRPSGCLALLSTLSLNLAQMNRCRPPRQVNMTPPGSGCQTHC